MTNSALRPVGNPAARSVGDMDVSKALPFLSGVLVLFVLQIASGTGAFYSLLVSAFLILAGVAFSLLGGLRNLLAICILILACQHILISQVAKLWFWEPADSTLTYPEETMGVYAVSMAGIACAAFVTKILNFQRQRPKVIIEPSARVLLPLALVSIFLAVIQTFVLNAYSVDAEGGVRAGGILGPLKIMTFIAPLSVASSTAYVIVASNGRKSVGWINMIPIALFVLAGIVGAGRSTMATSIITYLITCFAFKFRFRPIHYTTFAVLVYVAQMILFPYALHARSIVRTPDLARNIALSANLLVDVILNPIKYQETQPDRMTRGVKRVHYYAEQIPTLDRYSVIASTDAVVRATLVKGTTGMQTITPGFEMLPPRFLNESKPLYNTSNFIARRATGLVNEDDKTTQITLGMIPDSFSSYGWVGVAVIPFLISIVFFLFYTFLFDTWMQYNVLYPTFAFLLTWRFSEGTIAALILISIQYPIVTAVAIWMILFLINSLRPDLTRSKKTNRRIVPRDTTGVARNTAIR